MNNKLKIGIAFILSAILVGTIDVNAQRSDSTWNHQSQRRHHGRAFYFPAIPNLSAEQERKIESLHLSLRKESLSLRNLLSEKKAHLHTLQTADKTDINAVNMTIDEITKLQSQLMKKQAANREEIRKLLTDDQRIAFDSENDRRHKMHRRPAKRS